jgi:hypothetical protein
MSLGDHIEEHQAIGFQSFFNTAVFEGNAGKAFIVNSSEDGVSLADVASSESGNTQYIEVSLDSETSKLIYHDFGTYPVVTFIDSFGFVGIPSIQHITKNSLTVNFGSAVTGTLAICGSTVYSPNYLESTVSDQTSVVISHGFEQYPTVIFLDSSGVVGIPTIQHTSKNSVTVSFGIASTGTVVLSCGSAS